MFRRSALALFHCCCYSVIVGVDSHLIFFSIRWVGRESFAAAVVVSLVQRQAGIFRFADHVSQILDNKAFYRKFTANANITLRFANEANTKCNQFSRYISGTSSPPESIYNTCLSAKCSNFASFSSTLFKSLLGLTILFPNLGTDGICPYILVSALKYVALFFSPPY